MKNIVELQNYIILISFHIMCISFSHFWARNLGPGLGPGPRNFENNMKWLLERYDNIIHKLQKEVNELKTNNNNIIEGFKNKQNNQSNYNTFLSEQQINQIIFFIFASVLLILALNYIFELCG